jgi:hypothetical protein
VVALAGLTPFAHGGVYGAVAEAAIALAIGVLFAYVWLRERRRGDRPVAELRDDD